MFPYHRTKKPHLGAKYDKNHPLVKGLVGWWLMNEGSGGKVFDLSGNNNIGSLQGDTTWTAGKHGSCLSFDGNEDYVSLPFTSLAYPYTVCMWVKINDVERFYDYILERSNDTRTYFQSYPYQRMGTGYRIDGENVYIIHGPTPPIQDHWYFFCEVWKANGAGFLFYADGVLEIDHTSDGVVDAAYPVRFSGDHTLRSLDGQIDNVMIYDRALSAEEIKALYTNPFQMFKKQGIFWVPGGVEGETASYTPANVVLTIPSITATFISALTATITAISLLVSVPAVSASYVQEESATFTPANVVLTIPSNTATYASELSASFTPASVVVSVPAITATYTSELSSSFTATSLVLTIPATTATYASELSAEYTALSIIVTIPSITATSESGELASFTPLSAVLTIPANTATYTSELNASFSAISVVLTIPAFTPSYVLEKSASFTELSLVLTIPSVTASYNISGLGVLKVWNGVSWEVISDPSNCVPYTGATTDLDLGAYGIIAGKATIGGETNYTEIKTDGEINLHGTARVRKSLWLPFEALKAPGTKPADYVDHGIAGAWSFSDATDDTIVFLIEIPVDMDRSDAPTIKVGWSTSTTVTTETAVWQLEYLWVAPGDDTTAAAQETLVIQSNAIAQANGLIIAEFTGIDAPDANDVCIHCRLKRLGDDGNDDLTDTTELHGICFEYTSNKLGASL